MSDNSFKVPPGSELEIDLRRRRKTRPRRSEAADDSEGLVGGEGDSTRYVFRGPDTIQVYDLGTSLSAAAPPYEYVDDAAYASLPNLDHTTRYSPLNIINPGVGGGSFQMAPTGAYLTGEQRAALDAVVSAPEKLKTSALASGRKSPNVLALNYDSPARVSGLALYDADGHAYAIIGDASDLNWRWAARGVTGEEWAGSNTLHSLAPQAGRYSARRKHKYVRASLDDARYWPFDTGDAEHYRVTGEPQFDSSAVEFRAGFPLHVFAAPRLHRPYEAVHVAVIVPQVGSAWNSGVRAAAYVQEFGLHFAAREPEIPEPAFPTALEYLNTRPDGARTLRLRGGWLLFTGGPAPIPETAEEVGRRPLTSAELVAEATAAAGAMLSGTPDYANAVVEIAPTPLTILHDFADAGLSGRWLVGIIRAGRETYYVWRVG